MWPVAGGHFESDTNDSRANNGQSFLDDDDADDIERNVRTKKKNCWTLAALVMNNDSFVCPLIQTQAHSCLSTRYMLRQTYAVYASLFNGKGILIEFNVLIAEMNWLPLDREGNMSKAMFTLNSSIDAFQWDFYDFINTKKKNSLSISRIENWKCVTNTRQSHVRCD